MRRPHRSSALLALVLALLLPLAAACGDDDDSGDSSDGGADTSAETTAPADDGEASSQTTEATATSAADDPMADALAAQAEELGIVDVVTDGDAITLVMADGTDAAGVDAACDYGQVLNPDADLSVEVDGETTPC